MSGPWATAVGIQFSGSMDDARSVLAVPVKIGAVVTYDLNITHRGIRNLTWAVGGRNITNRNPPFSNLDWYGYAPGTHSPVGAYWYATARYRF
jgi:outer membrane receptor protein involved in Fe transport